MYRKCICIMVFLCLVAGGNRVCSGAKPHNIGNDYAETRYQDNWQNTGGDVYIGEEPFDSNFMRAKNWGSGKNSNRPPGNGKTYSDMNMLIRPPGRDTWVCFEGRRPEPNLWVDYNVNFARLSVLPWSGGSEIAGGQSFKFTVDPCNGANPDINCGVQIGICDKTTWDSSTGTTSGYGVLNVLGGHLYTPGYYAPEVEPCMCQPSGLYIGGGGIDITPLGSGTDGLNWGVVNLYGGSIVVPGIWINFGDVNIFGEGDYNAIGGGVRHLPGGLLYDTNEDPESLWIRNNHPMNKINIMGNPDLKSGELRLKGNRTEQVDALSLPDALSPDGRICACGGHGILYREYFSGTGDTNVTALCTPGSAWKPTPKNRQSRVPLGQVLSWTPGNWVQDAGLSGRHAVYFGTSRNDVANDDELNTLGTYKGRQDADTCTPSGGLPPGTVVYWRIDEFNDLGGGPDSNTWWPGNIWEFSTVGGAAVDPKPKDGAIGLSLPLKLSWTPGVFAADIKGHRLYFGTSHDDVCTATPSNPKFVYIGEKNKDANFFVLDKWDYNLTADTNYYWRVDENNSEIDPCFWAGDLWTFKNTNYFVVENFENYDGNTAMFARWKTGSAKDYNSCPLIKANGTIGWVYDPEHGGGVMQFNYINTTNPCCSYYFSEARFDANGAGAGGEDWTGGNALPDDPNYKARALAISYTGRPGNSTNNANGPDYDRMYVAIEDSAGHLGSIVKIGIPEAQRTDGQQRWDVNLYDLNSTNVNLKAVKYLYLGFGVRCPASGPIGGTGTVMFDDIRVYQKRCLPEYSNAADLTGDCKVDINDVNAFVDQWLSKQKTVIPVPPANDADHHLVLWYKFDDETTGRKVRNWGSCADCNGEVNSTRSTGENQLLWSTGSYDGSHCVNLNYVNAYDKETSVDVNLAALDFLATKHALTFSIWVNADPFAPSDSWARLISVCSKSTPPDPCLEAVEIECPTPHPPTQSTGPYVRFLTHPSDPCEREAETKDGVVQMSDFGGGWHHYAFTKNTDTNSMYVYLNGALIAKGEHTSRSMSSWFPLWYFHIGRAAYQTEPGSSPSERWVGKVDDFRVYDYALTQGQVAWLYGFRDVNFSPLAFNATANLRPSDPNDPNIVNFPDFAVLASKWLMSPPALWP